VQLWSPLFRDITPRRLVFDDQRFGTAWWSRNVGHQSPNDAALCLRRTEISTVSYCCLGIFYYGSHFEAYAVGERGVYKTVHSHTFLPIFFWSKFYTYLSSLLCVLHALNNSLLWVVRPCNVWWIVTCVQILCEFWGPPYTVFSSLLFPYVYHLKLFFLAPLSQTISFSFIFFLIWITKAYIHI
jgi:hypothetical protein